MQDAHAEAKEKENQRREATATRDKLKKAAMDATEARRQTEDLAAGLEDAKGRLQAQVMDLKRENKKQAAIITEQAAIIATLRKEVAAKAHTAATLEAHETTDTATPALTPTAPVSVRSRAEAELNWMKHVMEPSSYEEPVRASKKRVKGACWISGAVWNGKYTKRTGARDGILQRVHWR